eukprot:UN03500
MTFKAADTDSWILGWNTDDEFQDKFMSVGLYYCGENMNNKEVNAAIASVKTSKKITICGMDR